MTETGASVVLRGRGSGNKEGASGEGMQHHFELYHICHEVACSYIMPFLSNIEFEKFKNVVDPCFRWWRLRVWWCYFDGIPERHCTVQNYLNRCT